MIKGCNESRDVVIRDVITSHRLSGSVHCLYKKLKLTTTAPDTVDSLQSGISTTRLCDLADLAVLIAITERFSY
jgi:hypothetical protein